MSTNKLPLAKKSLGQHWLNDLDSLEKIVSYAQIKKDDYVLEIGPGAGTLTAILLSSNANIISLEIDQSLISNLEKNFQKEIVTKKLTLVLDDIRKFDLKSLTPGYKIVANIPYYLTSYLIRMVSSSDNQPSRAVLLIQKEVAERLTARPGDMSMLAVSSQLYFDIEKKDIIPAYLFIPPPKVDSRIVVLNKKNVKMFKEVDDYQPLIDFASLGFSQKRKKLVNTLSTKYSKDLVIKILLDLGLREDIRPQDLSLYNWYDLYVNLVKL